MLHRIIQFGSPRGQVMVGSFYLLHWASQVTEQYSTHLPMQETQVRSLGQEEPLEEGMETHFSILA